MSKFKADVQYWQESGWVGTKSHVETWEADTKEDLFLRMLKANNHIQKNFDDDEMNGDCYRFLDEDWKLQEEYDEWWRNLGEEKREEIFEKA
jgi:hypothetical protein